MKLQRYTDEQINSMNIMPDGTYDAEIIEFHDTDKYNQPMISKSGNPMTLVKLNVWDENGLVHSIFDYLVDIQSMAFKTKHFCEATGNLDKYEAEQEIKGHDVLGKRIKVVIGTQSPQPKPDGSFYPSKNQIKDYIKPLILVTKKESSETFEDDIAF